MNRTLGQVSIASLIRSIESQFYRKARQRPISGTITKLLEATCAQKRQPIQSESSTQNVFSRNTPPQNAFSPVRRPTTFIE